MGARAVLFDLDDTLIVDEAATRAAFAAAAACAARFGAAEKKFLADSVRLAGDLWRAGGHHEFCERIGINDAECLWCDFGDQTEELRALDAWAKRYRAEVFCRAFAEQEIECEDCAREVAETFAKVRRKGGHLMPDALETLARLRRSYRLGLLTNGAPDVQRGKLEAAGIANFFDAVVVSGDHPAGKPDPSVFFCLTGMLGVSPGEAVMVGNSLLRDIAGAKAAGIRSILLEVPGADEPADALPDARVRSLAELPALIAGMG